MQVFGDNAWVIFASALLAAKALRRIQQQHIEAGWGDGNLLLKLLVISVELLRGLRRQLLE